MFCPSCGTECSDASQYCSHCGTALEEARRVAGQQPTTSTDIEIELSPPKTVTPRGTRQPRPTVSPSPTPRTLPMNPPRPRTAMPPRREENRRYSWTWLIILLLTAPVWIRWLAQLFN